MIRGRVTEIGRPRVMLCQSMSVSLISIDRRIVLVIDVRVVLRASKDRGTAPNIQAASVQK